MINQVFLSYQNESPEHAQAVKQLGELLKQAGLPVMLDQFYLDQHPGGPDEGWPKWCEDCATESACVVIIASEGWLTAYSNPASGPGGFGAASEARLFRQDLYDKKGNNERIRLAFLHELEPRNIPAFLRGWHHFRLFGHEAEHERLVGWIRERIPTASIGSGAEFFGPPAEEPTLTLRVASDDLRAVSPTGSGTFTTLLVEMRKWSPTDAAPAADMTEPHRGEAKQEEKLTQCVLAHRGQFLTRVRGASFFAFQSGIEAVRCAVQVQNALHDGATASASRVVRPTIAVHTGEPDVHHEPGTPRVLLSGNDVDTVVRLAALARPSQILLSDITASHVKGHISTIHTHGHYLLRGLRPQPVYEVLWHEKQSAVRPPGGYVGAPLAFLSRFVGREAEILQVSRALMDHRLVSVVAGGGMGKTRLAVEVAARQSGTSLARQGVAYVRIYSGSGRSQAGVLGAFTQALGVSLEVAGTEEDALTGRIGEGSLLLVIDNCEAAALQVAGLVQTMLRRCPNLRILAISQQVLSLFAVEQIVRLAPMQAPPVGALPRERLENLDCFRLFANRARLRGWKQCGSDLPHVQNVLRLTDGIPLAIEFVAAWAGIRTLIEISEDLRDTPLQVAYPPHHPVTDEDKRHTSLLRCLKYSLSQLGSLARDSFPCIAFFEDTFTSIAFASVCGVSLAESQTLLTRFSDASLLRRIEFNGHYRYSAHRFTRAYSAELLSHDPVGREFAHRYVAHYCEFLKEKGGAIYQLRSSNILELEAEWRNVVKAVHTAEELAKWTDVVRLWRGLGPYLHLRGLWAELEELVKGVTNAPADRYSDRDRGHANHALGLIRERQGELSDAEKFYAKAQQYCASARDGVGVGMVLNSLGNIRRTCDDLDNARLAYEESMKQFEKAQEHPIGQGRPLKNLGLVYEQQGQLNQAMMQFQSALDLFRLYNDQLGEGEVLVNIGRVHVRQQNIEAASSALNQARKIFDDYRDLVGSARCLRVWGQLYGSQGNHREAIRSFGKSQEIYQQLGDAASEGITLFEIAKICHAEGHSIAAIKWAKKAKRMLASRGDRREFERVEAQLRKWGTGGERS
ncbi:MAG: tetratricopeptide repeat protein [Verrucomicrobiales bacterium]|nr:tetratricopeptide repeat protein [Verrucomicrobiales bacterium]